MASGIYNVLKEDMFVGDVNLGSGGDLVKVGLLDSSHTFTAINTIWGSVSANEISSGGYAAGGQTLASQTVTGGTTTAKWDGADTTWSSLTADIAHAVLYDTVNTNSLVCSIDFGGVQSLSAQDLTIQWDAAGIITLA